MPRVLVVEDDAEQARVLRAALTSGGYAVDTCFDGPSAVAAARRSWPDLVLLDINIPGCDGYDVCRALRSFESLERRTTILLATVRHDTVSKLLGFAAGADDYLLKPIDARELRSRVARWLESRERHDEQATRRRIEAVREIVAAVSRDVSEPLTLALKTANLALTARAPGDDLSGALSDVRGQLLRIAEVVRQLGQVDDRRAPSSTPG